MAAPAEKSEEVMYAIAKFRSLTKLMKLVNMTLITADATGKKLWASAMEAQGLKPTHVELAILNWVQKASMDQFDEVFEHMLTSSTTKEEEAAHIVAKVKAIVTGHAEVPAASVATTTTTHVQDAEQKKSDAEQAALQKKAVAAAAAPQHGKEARKSGKKRGGARAGTAHLTCPQSGCSELLVGKLAFVKHLVKKHKLKWRQAQAQAAQNK